MVVFDNLGNLIRSIALESNSEVFNEWKVLGEETKGRLVVGWVSQNQKDLQHVNTCIGLFFPDSNNFKILFKISGRLNIIQASVNEDISLLSYVAKNGEFHNYLYSHYIVHLHENEVSDSPLPSHIQRHSQIMATFVKTSKKSSRLLVMIHTEGILVINVSINDDEMKVSEPENITKAFSWAQWNFQTQTLYFIHFRQSIVYEDESEKKELVPTLSGFQFHPDLPHETVLNIPLNLPSLGKSGEPTTGLYEDDCIPLRVHDSALDLFVLSKEDGLVCICHHYLYQPIKPPGNDKNPENDSTTVHFAYSVTLLHHGCVVHCAIPGVSWALAKTLRPGFTLLGSQYLLIYGAGVFCHLLDIGLSHEPFCHILLPSELDSVPKGDVRLVPIIGEFTDHQRVSNESLTPAVMLDLNTLNLLEVEVAYNDLLTAFRTIDSEINRLAILHYFLVHLNSIDQVEEILGFLSTKPNDINVTKYIQEVLVGGAYSLAQKGLQSDTETLLRLLPMTCINPSGNSEIKVENKTITFSQEILWNTAMMLLSPQQRLVPYRTDLWTKLWDQLAKLSEVSRFKHSQVAEKLMVSLVCYQPEVLSRCSTPMSPAAGFISSSNFIDMSSLNQACGNRKNSGYDLPFYEVDSCTASKQEHIISVNMRELNMYLMKNSMREAPMHVHVVATRYVTAQLDISKQLCHILTRMAGLRDIVIVEKGFPLIRQLDDYHGKLLLTLLQRLHHATNMLAFPLPQGFSSFLCYLSFYFLPFHMFLQHLQSNVFQLQVDVMKEILKELEDSKDGVEKKLRLLQAMPRSRAKRLLNSWSHPASLMLRAREHALNVLSGVQAARPKLHGNTRRNAYATRGLAAFPSADRVSPLDTFLDLLTAKASLTELDFTLLIEATVSSTEDFY